MSHAEGDIPGRWRTLLTIILVPTKMAADDTTYISVSLEPDEDSAVDPWTFAGCQPVSDM